MPSRQAIAYLDCPVNPSSREIRIVKLLPRDFGRPVRCQFFTFPLEQCPPYTALSYTWGTSKVWGRIHFGHYYVPAGENLYHFLRQRSKDLTRRQRRYELYWIDALCIDQTSTTERNHQVGMMRDIYSNAETVGIWLGRATPRDEAVIKFIQKYEHRASHEHDLLEDLIAPHPDSGSSLALAFRRRLCEHAYWVRIWIVQEIICARKINLYWGNESFSWSCLGRIFQDLRVARSSYHVFPILTSSAATIFGVKSEWKGPIPLIQLLDTFRYQLSTDDRDQVYALLGLTSENLRVDVDYSKTLHEVLIDVLLKAHDAGHIRRRSDAAFYARILLYLDRGLVVFATEDMIKTLIEESGLRYQGEEEEGTRSRPPYPLLTER